MVIQEQGPRIDESAVLSLERLIGAALPSSYRSFLIRQNGGLPTPDIVDVAEFPKSPVDVQVFFGVGRGEKTSDIAWNLQLTSDHFEDATIPIACDSMGNLFLLNCNDGKVEYWDNIGSREIFLVAESFDDFLRNIREW